MLNVRPITDTAARIEALSAGIADVLRTYPDKDGAALASRILSVDSDVTEEGWLAEAERRLAAIQPLPRYR